MTTNTKKTLTENVFKTIHTINIGLVTWLLTTTITVDKKVSNLELNNSHTKEALIKVNSITDQIAPVIYQVELNTKVLEKNSELIKENAQDLAIIKSKLELK